MVREEADEENTRPPGQTLCGPGCGNICLMHQTAKRSKSGLSRNQNSINARRLRGIYFIEPDDEEFKRMMKNARRNCLPQCFANFNVGQHKTKYACTVEADETMRIRMEGSQSKNHEDHIAGNGVNSLSHNNLVHKFIPLPEAMKIPDVKAAVEKMDVVRKFRRGT